MRERTRRRETNELELQSRIYKLDKIKSRTDTAEERDEFKYRDTECNDYRSVINDE